jgi:hypothetical protein
MKLEIDEEVVEGIVVAALRQHISHTRRNICQLKSKKKTLGLKVFEQEDLVYNQHLLTALKTTHGYFGGDL